MELILATGIKIMIKRKPMKKNKAKAKFFESCEIYSIKTLEILGKS